MFFLKGTWHRIWPAIPVILLVPLAAAALTDLMPGDPALVILGDMARPEDLAAVNEQLGLDRPLLERYFEWMTHALRGDFGSSIGSGVPVSELILERVPVTFEIAVMATAIAAAISIPAAVYTAAHPGRLDRMLTGLSSALMSMPSFVLALVLIYLVVMQAELLPPIGWTSLFQDPIDNLRHALLPAVVVALGEVPVIHRLLRADMKMTLQENFILTARARGLSLRRILLRHALRPSFFSTVTVAGIAFGRMLGGTVIVETIFALPGLGALVAHSIFSKDIPTIQGLIFFVALVYIVINLLVDLAYGALDPRVRVKAV